MTNGNYGTSGYHYAADVGGLVAVLTDNGTVAASQTDSVLIAAVAGSTIRVLGIVLSADGTATDVTYGSKAGAGATTVRMGLIQTVATGALNIYLGDHGLFDCIDSEGLVVTTGSGATTTHFIRYCLI